MQNNHIECKTPKKFVSENEDFVNIFICNFDKNLFPANIVHLFDASVVKQNCFAYIIVIFTDLRLHLISHLYLLISIPFIIILNIVEILGVFNTNTIVLSSLIIDMFRC